MRYLEENSTFKVPERMIGAFDDWEVSEQIFDEKRAMWSIVKPGSDYKKVCLYRDGKDVFVYGDYGHFSFDKMSWTCNVHNLEYGNLDYQMRKLSRESQAAVHVYDDNTCSEHIIDWLQDYLYPICANCNDIIEAFRQFLDDNVWVLSNCDIDEFCEKHNCDELTDVLYFVSEALLNTDENEWIAWLRNNINRLEEFEDSYGSTLWDAGKCINQGFLISMYALEVCSEKLQLEKEQESCIENEY